MFVLPNWILLCEKCDNLLFAPKHVIYIACILFNAMQLIIDALCSFQDTNDSTEFNDGGKLLPLGGWEETCESAPPSL